jgi:hypothetical protein
MRPECYMFELMFTSYKFELRHLLDEWRIVYLTRFKLQVTRYYSQVTSRRTSYKFEIGHLLEEWRTELIFSSLLLVVDGSTEELAQVAAKDNSYKLKLQVTSKNLSYKVKLQATSYKGKLQASSNRWLVTNHN